MRREDRRLHWSKAPLQSIVEKSLPSPKRLRLAFGDYVCLEMPSDCIQYCDRVVAADTNTIACLTVRVIQLRSYSTLLS